MEKFFTPHFTIPLAIGIVTLGFGALQVMRGSDEIAIAKGCFLASALLLLAQAAVWFLHSRVRLFTRSIILLVSCLFIGMLATESVEYLKRRSNPDTLAPTPFPRLSPTLPSTLSPSLPPTQTTTSKTLAPTPTPLSRVTCTLLGEGGWARLAGYVEWRVSSINCSETTTFVTLKIKNTTPFNKDKAFSSFIVSPLKISSYDDQSTYKMVGVVNGRDGNRWKLNPKEEINIIVKFQPLKITSKIGRINFVDRNVKDSPLDAMFRLID